MAWKKIFWLVLASIVGFFSAIGGFLFSRSRDTNDRRIVDRSQEHIDRERKGIEEERKSIDRERNRIDQERKSIDREREGNNRLRDILEELGKRAKTGNKK